MKIMLFCFLSLILAACAPATSSPAQVSPTSETQINEENVMTLKISSPTFANGGAIPSDFSCDGRDISPALTWSDPPTGTQSFALIMDDPDASIGTWVHWIIFNIPGSTLDLKEGTPTDPQLSDGSLQGRTSAGSNGYHGPCPPSGTHRYFFKLYALDTMLSLSSNADKKELLAAMEGYILANVELMGTFSH